MLPCTDSDTATQIHSTLDSRAKTYMRASESVAGTWKIMVSKVRLWGNEAARLVPSTLHITRQPDFSSSSTFFAAWRPYLPSSACERPIRDDTSQNEQQAAIAGMRWCSAGHGHTSLESYDVAVRPLGGDTLQACSSAREKEKLPSPTTSVDMPQRSPRPEMPVDACQPNSPGSIRLPGRLSTTTPHHQSRGG